MTDKNTFTAKDINDILVGLTDQGADISELKKVLQVGACEFEWLPALYDCFVQVNYDGVNDDILQEINRYMSEYEFEKVLEDNE